MARATSGALLPLMRADGIAFAAFARDDGKLLSKYCRASRMIMLTDPLGTLDVLAGCAAAVRRAAMQSSCGQSRCSCSTMPASRGAKAGAASCYLSTFWYRRRRWHVFTAALRGCC
jgi:hypothetical protein